MAGRWLRDRTSLAGRTLKIAAIAIAAGMRTFAFGTRAFAFGMNAKAG
jgi:hypothetical protein